MQLYKYVPLVWAEQLTDEQKKLFRKRCECIRDNRFWFAKPEALNDPYDCNPIFKFDYTLEAIASILDEMNPDEINLALKTFPKCRTKNDIYKLFKKILNSTGTDNNIKKFPIWVLQSTVSRLVRIKIANTGVLCFTTDPKDILMWAHYADNHKGICFEITIPKDTHSLNKVKYTKEQPVFSLHEAMNERHGRLLDLFYTKSIHWKHEKEWRMISREGDVTREIPGAFVERIIYGINSSEETKTKITELIDRTINTEHLKMKKNYGLEYIT